MRALVDIGAADVMWFLGGAGSPCSIRWFDKVPPLGIPVWYLSSGAKRTEVPQYIPEQSTTPTEQPSTSRANPAVPAFPALRPPFPPSTPPSTNSHPAPPTPPPIP